MAIDFAAADARRRQRRPRPAVLTGTSPAEPGPVGFAGTLGDLAAAPFRGIEGAVQDAYGLADTLLFDQLPDYDERILGESRTGLGGLVEGVFNFGAGMVGASFVPLGWTARLGRLAPFVRGAVKGAIADFSVFDGHEERLSNLVQSFPALQNPLTEFLAADPEDGQLEGRFKNAIEGLGLGTLTELAVLSFKGLRAGRLARAAGKDPEAVERAIDKAAPHDQLEKALAKAGGRQVPVPDGAGQIGSPSLPQAAQGALGPVPVVQAPPPVPKLAPTEVLRTMGVSEEQAREFYQETARREAPFSHATLLQRDPLNPRVNPRKLSPPELLEQGMSKADLNLSSYQGPDGPLNLMRAMEQLVPLQGAGEKGVRTLDRVRTEGLKQLADMVSEGNPQRLLVAMQGEIGGLQGLDARLQAYRMGLNAQASYADKLAQKALSASGSERDMVAFRQALENMGEMHDLVKGIGREVSRGLGSNRNPVSSLAHLFDDDAVRATLHELGGKGRMEDLAKKYRVLFSASDNAVDRAARVGALAQATRGRRAFGVLNEYWYNALLGRPTTLVVNALSNALTTVYRPLELIAGGLITGDHAVVADGAREIGQLVHSASEAWQATAAALKGGGDVLDPRALFSDINDPARKAISTLGTKIDPESIHGQGIDWLGKLVRMPSTALTATDQFFQQLNYRAVARSELMKQGVAAGVPPQALAGYVTSEMDKLIYRGQAYGTAQLYKRGVDEAIKTGIRSKGAADEYAREYVRKALEQPEHQRLSALNSLAGARAQEATFTAPLEPGTVSYRVQEAVLNHWYLRLVMPFVRTPVNVFKFAHDRTSGAVLGVAQMLAGRRFPAFASALENSKNAFVRDMLSGDARKVADAKGRLALGMSTLALVVTKAAETDEDGMPLITGRGPVDKEQRRIMEDAGWQPYSIRVGDKYVAYGRLDPFASILGIAADVVNFAKYTTEEDQTHAEDFMFGTAVALVNNLTNKTYLSGLSNALDMLHDPTNRFGPWVNTLAGSFVPGQLAAATAVADPVLRDVRSMLDAQMARTPGLSDNLPPLRNVLGEPTTRAQALGSDASAIANAFVPVMYRTVSDDLVNKELARLKYGFTPPRRTKGLVDMSTMVGKSGQTVYDRWLELHGEVELGGRNLRQALRRTMTSKAYQSMSPESGGGVESPRIAVVQGIIEDYRAAAYRKLVKEYPELAQADRRRTQLRQARARGQELPPLAQVLR